MSDMSARPLSTVRLGIDEAGRGCVLGSLVVAIVAATEKERQLEDLRKLHEKGLLSREFGLVKNN